MNVKLAGLSSRRKLIFHVWLRRYKYISLPIIHLHNWLIYILIYSFVDNWPCLLSLCRIYVSRTHSYARTTRPQTGLLPRTSRIKSTLILSRYFPKLLFRSLKFPSYPDRTAVVCFLMTIDLAIPADWLRGRRRTSRIPVSDALFRDSGGGNYTSAKFLVWLNQSYIITVIRRWWTSTTAGPLVSIRLAQSLADHVITVHAYKSLQRVGGSVCLGHLSAPPRTNILCAKPAYTHGPIRKFVGNSFGIRAR